MMIIGFGSFQQTQQMKHCMPTPNKGLKDLLSKHFKLCIIDEFRTSKTCSHCIEGETCYAKQRECYYFVSPDDIIFIHIING